MGRVELFVYEHEQCGLYGCAPMNCACVLVVTQAVVVLNNVFYKLQLQKRFKRMNEVGRGREGKRRQREGGETPVVSPTKFHSTLFVKPY